MRIYTIYELKPSPTTVVRDVEGHSAKDAFIAYAREDARIHPGYSLIREGGVYLVASPNKNISTEEDGAIFEWRRIERPSFEAVRAEL